MATTPKDTNELEELKRQNRELKAKLSAVYQADVGGSGAAAQGGGDALGERSAKIAGANSGTIITGTQIISHYHASSSSQPSREGIAQRVAGYLAWLLDRTATIDEYLSHNIHLIYRLSSETISAAFTNELKKGVIFQFPFSYRGGVEASAGFLLLGSDGNLFLCVGVPTKLEFIGLKSAAPIVPDDADAATDVDDALDFSLV